MVWKNETITEMGLLSQMAYLSFGSDLVEGQSYNKFTDDGTIYYLDKTYKVIDYTNTSSDMQALLLESGGQYVIAFRGTAGWADAVVDGIIGLDNINQQYNDAVAFVNEALDRPEINESNLILTGHSLGGILTQQVGATQGLTGYAFNPYGVDRLLSMKPNDSLDALLAVALYNIMKLSGLGAPEAAWAKDHILNVSYSDFGLLNGDILSNLATELTSGHLGAYIRIYGEDIGLDGHSMIVLNKAIAHYNEVLEHFADKDFLKLSLAYMSTQSYEKTEAIFNDLDVYHASGLSFNFLIEDSASEIASAAKGDNAVLYALLHLNPFAIEGNLSAYDNLNPDDYSDMFFKDRADYLYYSINPEERYYGETSTIGTHYGNDGEILERTAHGADYKYFLFGGEGADTLNGGFIEDHLYGMDDNDVLKGNGGDDWLEGGKGEDELYGGRGDDTYISNDGDTILDDDGSGRVYFEGIKLTGGKRECDDGSSNDPNNDSGEYKGDGGTYMWQEDGTLVFEKDGKYLIIDNFKNGDLEIELKEKCTPPPPPKNPTPEEPYQHGSPLVLDLNNDGTTSTFIYKTSTYFDLDNDGLRERTGWVQGGDGLLTLDKNNDGIINNGNELFGNYTKDSLGKYANNGFDALTKYDDNHDGMINSSDNVYKALKVWQDSNSDGITDDGELKTLNELGISSINLSYVTADALEERNSIRETSTFTTQSTDADGNVTTQVSVVNDVWFDRDVKDTKSTIDYTQISDEIKSLGNVNGSGERMVA